MRPKKKLTEFVTKKNYIDATAVILYSLGCSLIHFTMIMTIFFVLKADIEKAIGYDIEYMNYIRSICTKVDTPGETDFECLTSMGNFN